MDADLPIEGGPIIPAAELEVSTSRASGPGGQHVNKTETRVSLTWSIILSGVLTDQERARLLTRLQSRLTNDGVLTVHVDESRSQLRNRELARERLAALVAEALKVQKRRRATRPSRGAVERRLKAKTARAAVKSARQKPRHDD
ncbi:MAG: aminoacyl-tRNA hydrolase [Myxococcales bacterium]|nr:aminoacyl-tRNA hydrolase [Myxococcales bacterium]